MDEQTCRVKEGWAFAAMTIPVAQASCANAWLSVLVTGLVCLGLTQCRWETVLPKWLSALQWLTAAFVAAELLRGTHICWPGRGAAFAVPVFLLLLAWMAAEAGELPTARAGNLLRYGVFGVMLALLYSGIRDAAPENLTRQELPTGSLAAAFLLPVLSDKTKKNPQLCGKLLLLGLLVSVIGTGVQGTGGDLYSLSRSISFMGVARRFESLTACAITVGCFTMLSFALCAAGSLWETWRRGDRRTGIRWMGITALVLCFANVSPSPWLLAAGMLSTFVLLPLWIKIKNFQN